MKITKHIILISIIALLLSGCGIYSDYQKAEELPTGDTNLYRNINSNDTLSLASVSWRELFVDQHLQTLIDEGLRNNVNLNITRMRVDDAEASLKAAKQAYLPSLNLAPQATISGTSGNTTPLAYNIPLQASWEVDIFGKLRNSKEKAKASLEQSKAYEQAVQTQLIATIANTYYTLLSLDKQLELSLKTLDNWNENIRVLEALKLSGKVTETSILQAKANKLSLEANIVSIKTQIEEMENTISAILSKPSAAIERGSLDEQEFPAEMSVGVPLQLLSNRPDVYQAEYYLAQMFYATNEARAAFYPSVTISATGSWTNNLGGVITNPGGWLINGVASALQPVFNRGSLKARLKISESQQEQALLQYKQTILDAANEVNSSMLQWQAAKRRLEFNAEQILELEKVLSNTELLLEYSNINYLEVLTAQNSLLQAQLSEATDRFNEIQSVINLYRALGGGKQ